MAEFKEFFESEIERIDIEKNAKELLLKLINVFSEQDHSGMSAELVRSIFVSKIRNGDFNQIEKTNEVNDITELYVNDIVTCINELLSTYNMHKDKVSDPKMVIDLFDNLIQYKPITPLSFEDDEWIIDEERDIFQNKRNPAVFKIGEKGRAYYLDAYYLYNENKGVWSGKLYFSDNTVLNKCYIKDPSKMPTIRIDLEVGEMNDGWYFKPIRKDNPQVKELMKYYDLEIIPMN